MSQTLCARKANSVPLSFIAQHSLVPGGQDTRTERYVQDYVLGVQALASYVVGVEHMCTTFLETEVKAFFAALTLPSPEKEKAENLYQRLRDVMSPGNAVKLRKYVTVDPERLKE